MKRLLLILTLGLSIAYGQTYTIKATVAPDSNWNSSKPRNIGIYPNNQYDSAFVAYLRLVNRLDSVYQNIQTAYKNQANTFTTNNLFNGYVGVDSLRGKTGSTTYWNKTGYHSALGASYMGNLSIGTLTTNGNTITSGAITASGKIASSVAAGNRAFEATSGGSIYTVGRYGSGNVGTILFNNGTGANLLIAEIATNVYGIGGGSEYAAPTNALQLNTSTGAATFASTVAATGFTIGGNSIVPQIIAGTNVTISPTSGYGIITINANTGTVATTAGGWVNPSNLRVYTATAADTVNIRVGNSDTTKGKALVSDWGDLWVKLGSIFDGAATFNSTINGITPRQGLGLSDTTKFVLKSDSTTMPGYATRTMLGTKEPTISSGTTSQYWRGDKSWQTLNQAAVAGLTTGDSPTFGGLTLNGNLSMGTNSVTAGAITSTGNGQFADSLWLVGTGRSDGVKVVHSGVGNYQIKMLSNGAFSLFGAGGTLNVGYNGTAQLSLGSSGINFNSQNITSVGTVSSGAITASGTIRSTIATGSRSFQADAGDIYFAARHASSNGTILFNNGSAGNLLLAETADNVYSLGGGSEYGVPTNAFQLNTSTGAATFSSTVNGFTLRQGSGLSDTTKFVLKSDTTLKDPGYVTQTQFATKQPLGTYLVPSDTNYIDSKLFQWSGTSTGLNASTGRTSLGLGNAALGDTNELDSKRFGGSYSPTFSNATLQGTQPTLALNDNNASYPYVSWRLGGTEKGLMGIARSAGNLISGLGAGGVGISTNSTEFAISTDYGTTKNFAIASGGAITTNSSIAAGGAVSGTSLATTGNGALNLGTGTITSGNINGQTISSAANFTGTLTVGGKVSSVNTQVAEGNGVEVTSDTLSWTGQSGNIGNPGVSFSNITSGHLYRFNYYIFTTTTGTAGTVTLTLQWSDGISLESASSSAVNLNSSSSYASGSVTFYNGALTPVWYTRVSGVTGSPQYAVYGAMTCLW